METKTSEVQAEKSLWRLKEARDEAYEAIFSVITVDPNEPEGHDLRYKVPFKEGLDATPFGDYLKAEVAFCHALAEKAMAESESKKVIQEARRKERLFVGAQMAFVQPKGAPIDKNNLRVVIQQLYEQESERARNYEWQVVREGHRILKEPLVLDEVNKLRARAILFMNFEQKLLGIEEIGRDKI